MNQIRSAGSTIITDNWLLQNAGELVTGGVSPTEQTGLITPSLAGLEMTTLPAGTVQIACLASLLEQITFAGEILVMPGWTDAWVGMSGTLDKLYGRGLISDVDAHQSAVAALRERYVADMCQFPGVSDEHALSMSAFTSGNPLFSGQVINGSAEYLAIASTTNEAYWPHPTRSHFLSRTLFVPKRSPLFNKLETLVRTARSRYQVMIGGRHTMVALEYKIPSIALLCMAESTSARQCVDVALELRNEREMKDLRSCIHEATMAREVDGKRMEATARLLDRALAEVERRLGTTPAAAADVQMQISTVSPVGLGVSVPLKSLNSLAQRPVKTPRYTAILQRMVRVGRHEVDQILNRAFGIRDRRIVDSLERL